jgi:hypothetical protein
VQKHTFILERTLLSGTTLYIAGYASSASYINLASRQATTCCPFRKELFVQPFLQKKTRSFRRVKVQFYTRTIDSTNATFGGTLQPLAGVCYRYTSVHYIVSRGYCLAEIWSWGSYLWVDFYTIKQHALSFLLGQLFQPAAGCLRILQTTFNACILIAG